MLPSAAAQAEIFIVLTQGSLYLKSIPDRKQIIPEDTETDFPTSVGSAGCNLVNVSPRNRTAEKGKA